MDNGHRGIVINPTSDFQHDASFFTAGVGDTPAEDNNYKPEDNLDEENWQKALNISKPVNIPSPTNITETVGDLETKTGEATPTPERLPNTAKLPNLNPPENKEPKLGEIATIENSISLPEAKKQPGYNPDSIKTTGDKLEKSSITEVDNAITELNQTGNLSNFYEEIRNMTETNLNNSFNRKLYQDDAGGNK